MGWAAVFPVTHPPLALSADADLQLLLYGVLTGSSCTPKTTKPQLPRSSSPALHPRPSFYFLDTYALLPHLDRCSREN